MEIKHKTKVRLRVKAYGPIEAGKIEIDRPITLIYGDSGTGKSMIVELMHLIIRDSARAQNEEEMKELLEDELICAYGSPSAVILKGEERAEVILETPEKSPSLRFTIEDDEVSVEEFSPPTEEYVKATIEESVIAPDTRIYIVRKELSLVEDMMKKARFSQKPKERLEEKSVWRGFRERTFAMKFREILMKKEGLSYISLALSPLRILRKELSIDWYYLKLNNIPLSLVSSSILSLISLSPIIYAISTRSGLLTSVDMPELHLTPALTCLVSILLSRLTIRRFIESEREEEATPLLTITHSPLVIAAMSLEAKGCFDDLKVGDLEPLKKAEEYFKGYLFSNGKIIEKSAKETLQEQDYMKVLVHDLPKRALKVLRT